VISSLPPNLVQPARAANHPRATDFRRRRAAPGVGCRARGASPLRLVGRPAIAAFWRDVCAREMTHAVGEEVAGDTRAAFVERCAYPDGCHFVSAMTLELRDGRIRRHLTVQAWDEVSCG